MVDFQSLGNSPMEKKDVKISDRGPAKTGASLLSKMGGRPSGPPEDFAFNLVSILKTAFWLKSMRSINVPTGTFQSKHCILPLSVVHNEVKKLLNKFARVNSLVTALPFLSRSVPTPCAPHHFLFTNS
jgi:hypothetical protein